MDEPVQETEVSQGNLPPRRARTNRKLVSIIFYFSQTTDNLYLECALPCANLFDLGTIFYSFTDPRLISCGKRGGKKAQTRRAKNQQEKPQTKRETKRKGMYI